MQELFGIPMDTLMIILLVIFGLGTAVTAFVAARNPVLFKAAIRNIPRRRTQTALIILGLMLATLLFSAALTTGDTISHSIRLGAINGQGLVDLTVSSTEEEAGGRSAYFDSSQIDLVREALAGDEQVAGIAPLARETAAVRAPETNLSEPRVTVMGIEQAAMANFDPVADSSGTTYSVTDLADDELYISQRLADELDVGAGDPIELFLGAEPVVMTVADVYESGPKPANNLSLTLPLARLQSLIGREDQINLILITNQGDALSGAEHSQAVLDTLETALAGTTLEAVSDKQEALEAADLIGNLFSSIFLLFGQFSIAAGILLIFLIFVMLAAERKRELGIIRAVGTQRRHVIQMFTYEGALYALMASAVGSLLGVVIGWVMVRVLVLAFGQLADNFFTITFYFNPRSLVIAYTMGMAFTFGVVLISSWRVSRLNIVRAVRDIPEPNIRSKNKKSLLAAILLPIFGLLFTMAGVQGEQLGVFMTGVSLLIIGIPTLAWRLGAPDRPSFTLAGVGLLVWWLLPDPPFVDTLLPDATGGIELFFISGVMVVLGAVWTVIYNADLLTGAFVFLFGWIKGFPPVARTAVGYSMNNRFRTGMTLAMFSLIVFTLVVMAFIIHSTSSSLADVDRLASGFDIEGQAGYANPIPDMEAAIAAHPDLSRDDFEVIASFSQMPIQVSQGENEPTDFILTGANEAYLDSVSYSFTPMAEGYETAEDVWQALRDGQDVAVVNAFLVPSSNNIIIGAPGFRLEGVTLEDEIIPKVYIDVTSPFTGESRQLQVIGVLESFAFYSGGPILTSEAILSSLSPVAIPASSYLFKVREGVDVAETARKLEATFVENGLQSSVTAETIAEQASANIVLNNLLQGFMSLGLVVGIAALGVIAARSVVERYHHIGMLRAIGFQQRMVQFSFMLESSFVTLVGIALGIALGIGISRNVIDSFAESTPGIEYVFPWANILLIVGVTYSAALLITFITARQAAKVNPAEALRFE